jgi:hypothetical protein
MASKPGKKREKFSRRAFKAVKNKIGRLFGRGKRAKAVGQKMVERLKNEKYEEMVLPGELVSFVESAFSGESKNFNTILQNYFTHLFGLSKSQDTLKRERAAAKRTILLEIMKDQSRLNDLKKKYDQILSR